MRSKAIGVIILFCLVFTWPPNAAAAADHSDSAEVEYDGGSAASGNIRASCAAAAVLPQPHKAGNFSFISNGGYVEHYLTEFKGATIRPDRDDPYHVPLKPAQSVDFDDIPAGHGQISWDASGRAAIFGDGWLDQFHEGDPGRFEVQLTADNLTTSILSSSIDSAEYFHAKNGVVATQRGGAWGWNRLVQVPAGFANASGDVSIYIEASHVQVGWNYSYQQPPFRENKTSAGNGYARYQEVRFHHSIIRLQAAQIFFEAVPPPIACGAMKIDIVGSIVAYGSKGTYLVQQRNSSFDQKEFSVSGDFQLLEQPLELDRTEGARGRMAASISGTFTAVGLDFIPQAIPSLGPLDAQELVLWATGFAFAGGLLWKTLLPLFTRLERSNLEKHPVRARIIEALDANPGSSVAQLTRLIGAGRSQVRYHVRVLRSQGRITSKRMDRDVGYFVPTALPTNPDALAAYRAQPLSKTILARLGNTQARQRDLIHAIRSQRRVSTIGVWKSLRKLESEGQVTIHRRGREVWVRPVSGA